MRTTVELSEEHRQALLKLAAERGEKGFSRLIEEALDSYLESQEEEVRRARVDAWIERLKDFPPESARHLEEHVSRLRDQWR